VTLAEFLSARLDADEAVALRITPGRKAENGKWRADSLLLAGLDRQSAAHIARHDPARVLADVEAKRAIVAEHACGDEDDKPPGFECDHCPRVLRLLAQPYRDHEDWREEWAT
jgi:hypothetical protein